MLIIALAMTWAAGDSQAEKFETARGFYVVTYDARKRPGKTLQGFQKALSRIPLRQLQAVAAGVRHQIRVRFAERWLSDGFEPMGCDGSRLECPRSAELEARLRQAGKEDSAPTVWVTAFVHLATGILWSWQLGSGTADERQHLRRLLATLSPAALIVADAAYMGYELVWAIVQTKRSFLLRMSSKVALYTADRTPLTTWSEGLVYCWPKYAQENGRPPLVCRLIRVPARGSVKHDVWLLTDVLDPARLSAATAARFYRWRWRNEGLFRIYKRTINKVKLSSRTVRLVHREAFVSLLAVQLLLAHAEWALRSPVPPVTPAISPRKVLIAIRKELKGTASRREGSYRKRLEGCRAETRRQKSPKARREWPRRKEHKPPRPPVLHTLTEEQKALLQQHFDAA
ncbi:MAG: transposase [Acetobacteraceae bacterium]|nr:transposase [Acetobacteraceae bacterium]